MAILAFAILPTAVSLFVAGTVVLHAERALAIALRIFISHGRPLRFFLGPA